MEPSQGCGGDGEGDSPPGNPCRPPFPHAAPWSGDTPAGVPRGESSVGAAGHRGEGAPRSPGANSRCPRGRGRPIPPPGVHPPPAAPRTRRAGVTRGGCGCWKLLINSGDLPQSLTPLPPPPPSGAPRVAARPAASTHPAAALPRAPVGSAGADDGVPVQRSPTGCGHGGVCRGAAGLWGESRDKRRAGGGGRAPASPRSQTRPPPRPPGRPLCSKRREGEPRRGLQTFPGGSPGPSPARGSYGL